MWILLLAALSAEELLTRSISYHDPGERWRSGAFRIVLSESRPDGSARTSEVVLDNARGRFELVRELADGARTRISDASSDLTAQEARTRDYYLDLYGLPMKLRDPGTRLVPEAGLRLPRVRKWYRHQDGEFLGTDSIRSIVPARDAAAR